MAFSTYMVVSRDPIPPAAFRAVAAIPLVTHLPLDYLSSSPMRPRIFATLALYGTRRHAPALVGISPEASPFTWTLVAARIFPKANTGK